MVGLALRLVLSLAIVLGLFWMVARTGSRKLGGRDRALMRVRSRQSLSRSSSLAVVEVGRRVLVVGVSDGGVRLLTEMDPADLEVAPEPAPARVRRNRTAAPAVAAAPALAVQGQAAPAQTAPAQTVPAQAGTPSDVEAALEALDARMAAYAPAGAEDDHSDETVDVQDQQSYHSYQQHYEQVYDVAPVRPRAEGALAGSLLSRSTWRAAWDTAVGRGHRPMDGDAA